MILARGAGRIFISPEDRGGHCHVCKALTEVRYLQLKSPDAVTSTEKHPRKGVTRLRLCSACLLAITDAWESA